MPLAAGSSDRLMPPICLGDEDLAYFLHEISEVSNEAMIALDNGRPSGHVFLFDGVSLIPQFKHDRDWSAVSERLWHEVGDSRLNGERIMNLAFRIAHRLRRELRHAA